MIYWVIMNLVTQSNLSAAVKIEEKLAEIMEKKEGDEEPIKAWKEHNEECQNMQRKLESLSSYFHLMHRKVDQITSCMGIALYYPEMELHVEGGSGCRVSGRSIDRTDNAPEEHRMDAVQLPGGRCQSAGQGLGF